MMNKQYPNIDKDKFRFVQIDERLHDTKFETKPIGYFKDAFIRFRKNKASVVAAVIIIIIIIFAVLTPFITRYQIYDSDGIYAKMRPKLSFMSGSGFWDGTTTKKLNDKYYIYVNAIGMGAADTKGEGNITWQEGINNEFAAIKAVGNDYESDKLTYRNARVDSYYMVGFRYISVTQTQFDAIRDWESKTGIQVIYPMVDTTNEYCDVNNADDANYWYRHAANGSALNDNGKRMKLQDVIKNGLSDNYLRDKNGEVQYYRQKDKNMLIARVLYYNYYQYVNGSEPVHVLGTDAQGYDILVRLAHGVRLSLILAFSVSLINLTLGAMYGAIEGYYGGAADLIMERISDILSGIPFMVVATLFQLHLVNTGKVSTLVGLVFAFCLTGWIGTAYRVRTQFYRFKNQEYILAARTLGAKDTRLMWKHIFPNALGTIITSSVLVIPSVIFEESILSYLGIVNFNSSNITSLGTMLSNGQSYLATDPHIILFPAIIISLLMISFNLFGNGLRDAFNPSLRGADE